MTMYNILDIDNVTPFGLITETDEERGIQIASELNGVSIVKPYRKYHIRGHTVILDEYYGYAGVGSCTCARHHDGHKCEHQFAATAWQIALMNAPLIAHEHGLTLDQLEIQLKDQLCLPIPKKTSTRLLIMLHAVQQHLSGN